MLAAPYGLVFGAREDAIGLSSQLGCTSFSDDALQRGG
ncbi:hypothetical protein CGRA01v4_11556 [Colletotrichum graminicola]|nr:hypothetical protein CGRA01v4_11556 [Colletotrichum graminicola]